jgi:hypothetical protein
MFDFLFGGKRKLELIRELVEQRMRDVGFDDMDSRLKVKQLGNMQLMGTPEAAIVTIIETTIKMQQQGMLLVQIIDALEMQRKSLGSDLSKYSEIMRIARGPNAGGAVPLYAQYRVNLEAPGRMSDDQFYNAFAKAMEVFAS